MEVTSWGKTYTVAVKEEKYWDNGGLAITMDYFDEEYECWMPFATLTVNLGRIGYDHAYVDTNNCPWAEEFIAKYGLGKFTGEYGYSGFCAYPLYKFDMDKIEEAA